MLPPQKIPYQIINKNILRKPYLCKNCLHCLVSKYQSRKDFVYGDFLKI